MTKKHSHLWWFSIMAFGTDILVGTPGRIKEHIQNSKPELSNMGFAEQVEENLGFSYKKGSENNPQTLLFSATCPQWVYDVAKKYMKEEYEQIDLTGKKSQRPATTVEHLAIQCRSSQRAGVLGDIIHVYSGSHGRTVVFCEEENELALNASLKQDAQSFGVVEVLTATNVAARGLDIPEYDLVIQCSPPKDVDSYIHRSGRTGRAEQLGEEVDDKISAVCFLKGKMGVCSDIPADKLSNIQEQWKDTRSWQLSVAKELPELEEFPQRGDEASPGLEMGGGRNLSTYHATSSGTDDHLWPFLLFTCWAWLIPIPHVAS
uniref:RNA helicase n=1 Tax=Athene cunicularia TaxID=194338 RepID=A0A663N6I5_ATHCN